MTRCLHDRPNAHEPTRLKAKLGEALPGAWSVLRTSDQFSSLRISFRDLVTRSRPIVGQSTEQDRARASRLMESSSDAASSKGLHVAHRPIDTIGL